jgi:hypothetical protein
MTQRDAIMIGSVLMGDVTEGSVFKQVCVPRALPDNGLTVFYIGGVLETPQ